MKKSKSSNIMNKAKLVPLIKSLSKMKQDDVSHCVDCLNDETVDSICECVYNVIFTDLKLSSKKKASLKRHIKTKCSIEKIKKITKKSYPVSKRRELLKQEGSGLPLLLMTAVPFLIDLVKSAFSK